MRTSPERRAAKQRIAAVAAAGGGSAAPGPPTSRCGRDCHSDGHSRGATLHGVHAAIACSAVSRPSLEPLRSPSPRPSPAHRPPIWLHTRSSLDVDEALAEECAQQGAAGHACGLILRMQQRRDRVRQAPVGPGHASGAHAGRPGAAYRAPVGAAAASSAGDPDDAVGGAHAVGVRVARGTDPGSPHAAAHERAAWRAVQRETPIADEPSQVGAAAHLAPAPSSSSPRQRGGARDAGEAAGSSTAGDSRRHAIAAWARGRAIRLGDACYDGG